MTHTRSASLESLISALFSKPDKYWDLYENGPDTEDLADSARVNVIQKHQESLRKGHTTCLLDSLLLYMLTEAPHPAGKRHVAVSLHIADANGDAAVVELAKVWMEYLVLPMVCIAKITQAAFEDNQIEESTSEYYAQMKSQVTEREQRRCAITNGFDRLYALNLLKYGRAKDVPPGRQIIVAVTHIIPFLLGDYAQRHLNENTGPGEKDAINTLDLLRAWTNLEPSDLTTDKIDSPANGMLISTADYSYFRCLLMYFDKDAYPESPNKYKVRMMLNQATLPDGRESADVEFQARNGIEPPNPYFFKIHASIVKVVFFSNAFGYYHSLEESNPVQLDNERGSALLAYKLSSLALR